MSRLIARMEVLLGGNVSRIARRYGRDMDTMGERGSRAMDRMDRRARMAGDGVAMLARRAGALAGAFVGMQEVRRLMSLEERLERLGISAGKSTGEMMAMRREIDEVALADDIRIDPSDLIGAIETFTEATGEIDIADKMKREIALAIQATGSGGEEIGRLMASIFGKFDIEGPDEMLAALDLLARQGKDGAIELANLASLGPKVFSAYASLGKGGLEGLSEAGALMQIFKRGVGSAEEAGTVFENVFNALGKKTNLDKLEQVGIDIRDGAGALLQPVELLKTVVKAADGNDMRLQGVFNDAQVMSGLRQLSSMFRGAGGFEDLDAIIDLRLDADGSQIVGDSARIAATAGAAATDAVGEVRSAVADAVEEMELLEMFADALGEIEQEDVELLFKAAAGVGALWAAFKVGGAVKDGITLMRTLKGGVSFAASAQHGPLASSPLGGAASPSGAVQPVFVTNWPGGDEPENSDASSASDASHGSPAVDKSGINGIHVVNAMAAAAATYSALSEMDKRVAERTDDLVEAGHDRASAEEQALSDVQEENRDSFYQAPVLRELSRFSVHMRHLVGRRADDETYLAYPDLAEQAPPKSVSDDTAHDSPPQPERLLQPISRSDIVPPVPKVDLSVMLEQSSPAPAAGSAIDLAPSASSPAVDTSTLEDLGDEQVGELRALRRSIDRLGGRMIDRPVPRMSRPATGRIELLP